MTPEVMSVITDRLFHADRKVLEVEVRFWEEGSYFKDFHDRLSIRCTNATTLSSILAALGVGRYTGFSLHIIDAPPPKTVKELQPLATVREEGEGIMEKV